MKRIKKEKATFAMGCFWQPDYVFSKIKGVLSTKVGYTGCHPDYTNPTYEEVCSDKSGCAEAIEIEFDPSILTYGDMLDIFWKNHDPTQINRQGPDVGTQYRSAIFCHTPEQKKLALISKKRWTKRLIDDSRAIVTEIKDAQKFYPAEDYHQNYLAKTGRVCHISRSPFK